MLLAGGHAVAEALLQCSVATRASIRTKPSSGCSPSCTALPASHELRPDYHRHQPPRMGRPSRAGDPIRFHWTRRAGPRCNAAWTVDRNSGQRSCTCWSPRSPHLPLANLGLLSHPRPAPRGGQTEDTALHPLIDLVNTSAPPSSVDTRRRAHLLRRPRRPRLLATRAANLVKRRHEAYSRRGRLRVMGFASHSDVGSRRYCSQTQHRICWSEALRSWRERQLDQLTDGSSYVHAVASWRSYQGA